MRDTYADTSLARADLGFTRPCRWLDGLAAEDALARVVSRDCMTQNRIAAPIAASRRVRGLVALAAGACGGKKDAVPPGTAEADKFLFERGTEALNRKKWLTAREFFKQLIDTYTQSPYRPDAKLGVGDTYLGEGSTESLVLAITEFQEFLTFLPDAPARRLRAVQAGAVPLPADARAASAIRRETRDAVQRVRDVRRAVSEQRADAGGEDALREARDRLSTSEYQVGHFYFRQRWYPGAIDRLKALLKDDPDFTSRDALYFYLGESLLKVKREAEALPYFERLVEGVRAERVPAQAKKRARGVQGDGRRHGARRHRRCERPAGTPPPGTATPATPADGKPPGSSVPPPSAPTLTTAIRDRCVIRSDCAVRPVAGLPAR